MTVLLDMHRIGPAPTWERELAAAAANLLFTLVVAGVLVVALDRALVAGVLVVVMGVWIGIRLVLAARRRGDAGVPR